MNKATCGTCFFWHRMDEQPPGVPKDRIIGICRGAPPTVLLTPVVVNVSKGGIVTAKDGQPQTALVPQIYAPPLQDNEPACARHQDENLRLARYVRDSLSGHLNSDITIAQVLALDGRKPDA